MHVKKIRNIESEVLKSGEGVSRQMLIGPDEGPNFAMRKLVIEPGGGMPSHTSAAEHEQYVLGGRAKVGIGDRVYEVEKDDVIFIPAGEPHWYEAHGEEPFELLSVIPNGDNRMVFAE